MTFWQWLTTGLYLENERDIWARIGFLFVWCTGLYFLVTSILSIFGVMPLPWLSPWLTLFIVCIPILGGIIDWRRLSVV